MSVVSERIGARIGVGAICGLAWAAALREYMSEISGAASTVEWAGTFVGVLLPGVIVGGALGAASVLRPEGRQRVALRWCAAAPLAFAVIPMLLPGLLWALVTTGLGGGAVGVALGGLAGGYALGGRRRWARIATGTVACVLVLGVAASVPGIGGAPLAVTTPRGAWVTLLAASLMVVYAVCCAIPFRRLNLEATDAPLRDAAARTPTAPERGRANADTSAD